MDLIYQGFDGLDVSFQGIFPWRVLYQLKEAKTQAQNDRKPVLLLMGEKGIPVHVSETGGVGGYAYRFDTGIDRETWFVADSESPDRWNIRVSVKSLALALHGYEGVKAKILKFLKDMRAVGDLPKSALLERVSRFDYCFDFLSDDFSINPKCIQAHSRATRRFIGSQQLISRNKDIETVMIGKMPGRQVVFYDKSKEVNIRAKDHWWSIWGIEKEGFKKKITRIEIRAGKEELNSWNIKRFKDFEEKAADTLLNIANSIRYIKPNYHDKNTARWKNKEFWDALLNAIQKDLFEFSSNAVRGEIIYAKRFIKIQEYKNLIINLIPPYMAVTGKKFEDLPKVLKEISALIEQEFTYDSDLFHKKIQNSYDRFIFLD